METNSIIIGGDFDVPLAYDTDTPSRLALACFGTLGSSLFNFLNYFIWLRINDQGSVPEMRIWSILLIKSDIKWCIHLGRSLFLYIYKQKNNVKSIAEIKNMIDYLDLVDIYRAHNPHVKRFTWRGPNHKQSTLDYFVISSDLAQFTKISSFDIAYKSDHSQVSMSMNFTNQQRGKGTWKFNNTLLYDPEYVQIIKDCIHKTTLQYTGRDASLAIDNQLLWETIKLKIRGKAISYTNASYKKKEREKQEMELKETLKTLYDKPLDDDIKFQIKTHFGKYERKRSKVFN